MNVRSFSRIATVPALVLACAVALPACSAGSTPAGSAAAGATGSSVAQAPAVTGGSGTGAGNGSGQATGSSAAGNGSAPAKGSAGDGCRNLAADETVRAAVTAAHSSYSKLVHIQPVPGSFYFGACGSSQYAASRFQAGPGAGYAEGVGLQDDGATMQYFAKAPGGAWKHVAADRIPRDPRGCAAIDAVPATLAALWNGCPTP